MLININTKEKFNDLKNYANDMWEESDFSKTFPRICLKIFFDLSNDDIEDAIEYLETDDESIDAFFFNETEKIVYICQFKSKENFKENCDFKKDWASLFSNCDIKITDPKFTPTNPRIKQIATTILEKKEDGYTIEKHFFHLGDATDTILENYCNSFEYFNQTKILEQFNYFIHKNQTNEPNSIDLEINYGKNQTSNYGKNTVISFEPERGVKYKSLVMILNAYQIYEIIRDYGPSLFDRNVRYFIGNKGINKKIIDTLKTEPEKFYFYNNGITITTEKLNLTHLKDDGKPKKLSLSKPQITNGAQTSSSIYKAYNDIYSQKLKDSKSTTEASKKTKEWLENALILCKVFETNKNENAQFARKVSEFNNSQNKVELSDFYSNNPEQQKIKEELDKNNIEYITKRGELVTVKMKKNEKIKIVISDLAEALYAQKINPFKAKESFILRTEQENNEYMLLFGTNKADIDKNKINDILLTIHLILEIKRIKKIIKNTVKILLELRLHKNLDNREVDIKLREINVEFFSLLKFNREVIISKWSKSLLNKNSEILDDIFFINNNFDEKRYSFIIRKFIEEYVTSDGLKAKDKLTLYISNKNLTEFYNFIRNNFRIFISIDENFCKDVLNEYKTVKKNDTTFIILEKNINKILESSDTKLAI